ncbi:hypothetical protein [Eikenella sp. Marseille-P7795]|uniref:hypothetical protein n=1 Tax=Eikenella sp. Marseille-P7795 TaxID=2866577 RepID=UPI001CE45826|nr:hypothetical protein [Eikenella sp. Marseille-P7795]
MYTIQPDYDGMLADYLDEISAADYEESRQAAEALRLEKEYRSEIIREWAEVSGSLSNSPQRNRPDRGGWRKRAMR